VTGEAVNGLTTHLVTKADGTKFGKTESGTVWLDAGLTSPYAFFQFWVNADDRDVVQLLRTFTFRSKDEIAELEHATADRPQAREAQRALAREVTSLVHGQHHADQAEAAARALFGQGELRDLDAATLDAAMREAPHAEVAHADTYPVVELLVSCGLVASNGAARRAISEGGISVNNIRVQAEDHVVTSGDFLHGTWVVLRRGKRTFGGITRG
jgi:tyrosyl-tRNA synthetase